MMNNEHVLSEKRDRWFLQQGRNEGITGDAFRAGDHIVVCGKCRRVWFVESWKVKGRCPNTSCRFTQTRPFQKSIFELGETHRIHIRQVESQKIAGASAGWKKAFDSFFCACSRVFPKLATGLIIAAIGLTIFQTVPSSSLLTGKPAGYYRGTIVQKLQKAGSSAAVNLTDIRNSVKDSFAKGRSSVADGAADTELLGEKAVQSAADSIDKILR